MCGNFKLWMGVWMVTWSLLGWAGNATKENSQLSVFVAERAGADVRILSAAEQDATRVFHHAGVDVDWINCGENAGEDGAGACSDPTRTDLIVRLVPHARTLSGDFFGVAFPTHEGGVYADVFFDPIQQLGEQSKEAPLASILRNVLAHEVGHLLLGTNSHSGEGIMQAHWRSGQLQQIAKGQLRFTKQQAIRIRSRVSALRNNQRNDSILAAVRD